MSKWRIYSGGNRYTNGGWEYPVFLAAVSLVHALLGDGRWTLRTGVAAPALAGPAVRRTA